MRGRIAERRWNGTIYTGSLTRTVHGIIREYPTVMVEALPVRAMVTAAGGGC